MFSELDVLKVKSLYKEGVELVFETSYKYSTKPLCRLALEAHSQVERIERKSQKKLLGIQKFYFNQRNVEDTKIQLPLLVIEVYQYLGQCVQLSQSGNQGLPYHRTSCSGLGSNNIKNCYQDYL